jgi:pSer/pThr/pTyr-binding forkhead associated (FHA) protein
MSSEQFVLIMQKTNQRFPLGQTVMTIGRRGDNQIVLDNDSKVSRQHASITWQADHYVVQDLGSGNGTYVNSQRIITPHSLKPGDLLQLGQTIFELHLVPAEAEPDPEQEIDEEPATLLVSDKDVKAALGKTDVAPATRPHSGAGPVPPKKPTKSAGIGGFFKRLLGREEQ